MRGLKLKLPGGQWLGCSFLGVCVCGGGGHLNTVFVESGSFLLVDDAVALKSPLLLKLSVLLVRFSFRFRKSHVGVWCAVKSAVGHC